jgi:hypothetical protein
MRGSAMKSSSAIEGGETHEWKEENMSALVWLQGRPYHPAGFLSSPRLPRS